MSGDGNGSLRGLAGSRLFVALVFAFTAADLLVQFALELSRALSDFINNYGHGRFGLAPGHLIFITHGSGLDFEHGLVLPLLALLIFALVAARLLDGLRSGETRRPEDDAERPDGSGPQG